MIFYRGAIRGAYSSSNSSINVLKTDHKMVLHAPNPSLPSLHHSLFNRRERMVAFSFILANIFLFILTIKYILFYYQSLYILPYLYNKYINCTFNIWFSLEFREIYSRGALTFLTFQEGLRVTQPPLYPSEIIVFANP